MKRIGKRKLVCCLSVLCMTALCFVGCGQKQVVDVKDNVFNISIGTSTGTKLDGDTQEDTTNTSESISISEGVSESTSINMSDSVSLGVSESLSVGSAESKQETTSVTHTYGTSVSQSVSMNTTSNIQTVVPDGKTIELKKDEFVHPDNFDFGNNQKFAVEIYEYIIKQSKSFDVKTKFTSIEEAKQFLREFSRCVPPEVEIEIVKSTKSVKQADGSISEVPVYRFEYQIFTTKENLSTAVNKSYDACIKAGVQTGMTEKEAVEKMSSWIIQHMTYEINDGNAYVGFTTGRGQCMTYAKMFEAMCKSCGIECEYIVGMDGTHAWNKVKIGNEWFWSDLTWADSEDGSAYLLSDTLWDSHWL